MNSEEKQNEHTVRNNAAAQQERLRREHEWRQILQHQFGELWFRLNTLKDSGRGSEDSMTATVPAFSESASRPEKSA